MPIGRHRDKDPPTTCDAGETPTRVNFRLVDDFALAFRQQMPYSSLRMAIRKPKQGTLKFRTWGGARKGAGRPRGPRPRVHHRKRGAFRKGQPLHLTVRLRVSGMRLDKVHSAVRHVLIALHALRSDFRVIDYSIQDDHLHFVVEADSTEALRFGAYALPIRLGKRINMALGRSGRLLADRHHRRTLATPREVRNARAYVLLNRRRHLAKMKRPMELGIDPFSSGAWFDGWNRPVQRGRAEPSPVRPPRTWLAGTGWKRRGLLSSSEIPDSDAQL